LFLKNFTDLQKKLADTITQITTERLQRIILIKMAKHEQ